MATFPANPALPRPFVSGRHWTRLLRRALCLWHLTSLDAPTVAVVWTAAFSWAAHLQLAAWWLPAMALAVWAIYIGDRLLDAHGGHHHLQPRHHFHWQHRRWLRAVAIAAALVAGWLVLDHLPLVSLQRDSVLGLATVAYFSGIHARFRMPRWMARVVSRESVVGVIFTLGCALPVFSTSSFNTHPATAISALLWPLVFFSALACLNVYSITCWEAPQAGRMQPQQLGLLLAALAAPIAALLFQSHPRSAVLIIAGALSSLLLAALNSLRSRIDALTLRAAADLILLPPLLLMLCSISH